MIVAKAAGKKASFTGDPISTTSTRYISTLVTGMLLDGAQQPAFQRVLQAILPSIAKPNSSKVTMGILKGNVYIFNAFAVGDILTESKSLLDIQSEIKHLWNFK